VTDLSRAELLALLDAVSRGTLPIADAARRIDGEAIADLGFARVDLERGARTGQTEVVFGEGKPPERIGAIIDAQLARGQPVLVTRVDPDKAAAVLAQDGRPGLHYDTDARCLLAGERPAPSLPGRVEVVCAGTSDIPVAREAALCAEAFGCTVGRLDDVGVAGLHRLLAHVGRLREASVLIVVAGMEGALPSVVAGLVDPPVIAVPTSVGYGAGAGGVAALMGMLTSCASGLAVVNIDNGFGAAACAARILRGGGEAP
jgi:NCAIR mutase (PurE)-related protein